MSTIPVSAFISAVITLLTEAYDGPPDPRTTWFIDNEPDSGVLGILAGVSAAEASKSVDGSGKKGTTIAAHAEHLRWSLENINNTIRGAAWNVAWATSWQRETVSETEWDQLRQALRVEFETLRDLIRQQNEFESEYLTGTLALLPHAAYHLGIIRQMVERVRS
jgi:hypothetical protein